MASNLSVLVFGIWDFRSNKQRDTCSKLCVLILNPILILFNFNFVFVGDTANDGNVVCVMRRWQGVERGIVSPTNSDFGLVSLPPSLCLSIDFNCVCVCVWITCS